MIPAPVNVTHKQPQPNAGSAPAPEPLSPLSLIKLVMLVLATAFGAWRGFQDLYIGLSEREPTSFEAASFAEHYAGQEWLRVHGRVAVEHMFVRPSMHSAHTGKDLNYVHVPIVSEDWTPSERVHVIATYGPLPSAELDSWRDAIAASEAIEGQLRFSPLAEPEAMFPEVSLSDNMVVINDGTSPSSTKAIVFLSIMFIAGGLAVIVLRDIVRERRAFAAASAAA